MTETTDIPTTEEAARFLGISARRLRQHQAAGRIFPTPGPNLRSPYGGQCNYYARADLLDLLGGPEALHALLARRLEDEARRLTESVRYQHAATKTVERPGVAKAREEAETLRRKAAAPQPQQERAYGGAGFGEIGVEEERVSVWEPPPGFEEDIPEIRIRRRSPAPRYGAF